jgi:hypothetical protein
MARDERRDAAAAHAISYRSRDAMRAEARRRALGAALAVLYSIALLVPFRPFLPGFTSHIIGDHGDALLQHLHCAWQWLALSEGRPAELLKLPTLHPYSSGLAFGEPLLGITLPFWPIQALTGSTAAAFNAAVVASFFLLAVAIFLWTRDLFDSAAAGLFAAVLVVFIPWRLHYLSALNVLSVHFVVFGLWLIGRWIRRPDLGSLVGAALLFHLQLVTAAQAVIPGIYLACVWLSVVWLGSGLRLSRRRIWQGLLAGLLFIALGLPWLAFFSEAFDATSGLLRTTAMSRYSEPFGAMARLVGMAGPLGVCAALGVPALAIAARGRMLPRGSFLSLIGLGCGAAALFVTGRGSYLGPHNDPTALPGYYAALYLPLFDALRAPIRLTALTPVVLALLAGGMFATFERFARRALPQRLAPILLFAPLALTVFWPRLDPGMASPIATRPRDLALATQLAALPPGSVILPLPLALGPELGAPVDERVLIHRHAQIGGFASIVPAVFPQTRSRLGQWPRAGLTFAHALGTTHIVVPDRWVERHGATIEREGYERVAGAGGRTIFAMPRVEPSDSSLWLRAPSTAAPGRWLTLALYRTAQRFEPRGHAELSAVWRTGEREQRVPALAFFPGVVGPRDPILIHVPTPAAPGLSRVSVDFPGFPVDAKVELRPQSTSFDAQIRDVSIALAESYPVPAAVRASAAFRVDVDLVAAAGPILLASSRHPLPERRGETVVAYRYRSREHTTAPIRLGPRAALPGDLVPGDRATRTWYLRTPVAPGTYDLLVSLRATGVPGNPMPWVTLFSDLRVVAE